MKKGMLSLILWVLAVSGVMGQNDSNKAWERRRIDAWISTMGGETFEGQILAANDNQFAIWSSKDTFNLEMAREKVIIIHPEDISLIRLRRKTQVWRGVGIGAGIGITSGAVVGAASEPGFLGRAFNIVFGGIVVGVPGTIVGGLAGASKRVNEDINIGGDPDLYLEILPVIQKRFALKDAEVLAQLTDSTFEDTGDEPIQGTPPENSFDSFRLHIGGGIGLNVTGLGNHSVRAFEDAGMNVTIDDRNRLGLGLDVMGNITPKLRLGLSFVSGQDQYIGGFQNYSLGDTLIELGGEEVSSHNTFALTFDYVPRPTQRLLLNRLEYYVGGGLVLNHIRVSNAMRGSMYPNFSSSFENVFFEAMNRERQFIQPGLQLRAGVDYYVLPSVSFYGQISGSLILDGIGEEYKLPLEPTSLPPQGLEEHRLNGSNWGILVGVRVHFLPD